MTLLNTYLFKHPFKHLRGLKLSRILSVLLSFVNIRYEQILTSTNGDPTVSKLYEIQCSKNLDGTPATHYYSKAV